MTFVKQILNLLPILMNGITNNCTVTWMAVAVYFMLQPGAQPSATLAECGLMASFYQVGRISLAIPAGLLIDKFGYKHIIITVACIQFVSWTILSVSHSVWVIIVVRFFQGSAAALLMSAAPNIVGEICIPKYRGFIFGLMKLVGTLGSIIESSLARISSSYSTTVYATTAISFLFFPTIVWLIESPYYLIKNSKYDKAKQILVKLRDGYSEAEISAEFEEIKKYIEEEQSKKEGQNWLQYLTSRSIRKPLVCCILLNFLVFSNGNHVLFVYASVIFPPNEYFTEHTYPLLMALVSLISLFISVSFLESLPRRQLFILAAFLSFLIQSCNGFVHYAYSEAVDEHQRQALQWTFLVGVLLFWAFSQSVLDPLNMAVRSEILPVHIRGFGTSICTICQALSAILCYHVFNFVQAHFGIAMNFAIFALDSLLIIVVVYFLLPETRGKTLAEVQKINNRQ